jgi:hypothetical protein
MSSEHFGQLAWQFKKMNLKRLDIFQAKTIRGAPKMPTELRYIEVRLLRRRRQIADRHVLESCGGEEG